MLCDHEKNILFCEIRAGRKEQKKRSIPLFYLSVFWFGFIDNILRGAGQESGDVINDHFHQSPACGLRGPGDMGCDEAIFVDDDGFITEGAGSAFFALLGGNLQTAPLTSNILPSITRKFVIEAGGKIGLKIIEKSLTPQQAGSADELFIAVTTKDIVPVVKFDDKIISDGKPGNYTKLLTEEFLSFTV